jgi:hypothetical protein
MGQWLFARQQADDDRSEAKEETLFQDDQSGEDEYAGSDSLVREILQNAIDARAGQEPVRLRFAVHEDQDAPAPQRLAYYFQRLREPLEKRQLDCDPNGVPRIPCRFLVVEDFGTKGLEGDPARKSDPPPHDTTPQSFYWFWRNNWRSAKTGVELGRHGLGKTVFRAVSRTGCMFGLTVRQSDRRQLLMGKAFLHLHEFQGTEYKANGYWCHKPDDVGLALPVENPQELSQFVQEWKLRRRDEPGLSAVSPFVSAELKAERLAQAVAVHFFARILSGDLVVEVVGKEFGELRLDRERLADACDRMEWNGPARSKRHVRPPIEFASRCLAATPVVETPILGLDRVPDWEETIFTADQLRALRTEFARGEPVGVRVRLSLPTKNGAPRDGAFDVWLQRTPQEQRGDCYYIREGMTITKISSNACRRGCQGLVFVKQGALSELLGDTEGPSHEDWGANPDRADLKWKTWKGRVQFVRRAIGSLAEMLTKSEAGANHELLIDFFSIEPPHNRPLQRRLGDGRPDTQKLDIPEVAPKWFLIANRAGGFAVRRDKRVDMPANARLRVSVAYDIPSGDPIRKWNPLDFRISDKPKTLNPKGHGCLAAMLEGNIVELRDVAQDFEFSVEGFDPHRDLFVRVDDMSDQQTE